MTDEEIRQLKHFLSSAVEAAYTEPELLIKSDGTAREGNEQTIAFRVGVYLHELLKETPYARFNLDCEYNKHGDNPKERPNGSRMRPDLLIHSRGNDKYNILAVEFAGWWKLRDRHHEVEEDRNKLKELTDQNYDYKYRLGALVLLMEGDKPKYEFFRHGEASES